MFEIPKFNLVVRSSKYKMKDGLATNE